MRNAPNRHCSRSNTLRNSVLRVNVHSAAVRVSPLARRLAEELGVDTEQLAGSRPGRRIERADVEQAARALPAAALPAPPSATPAQTQPISGVRRIIAARLAASAHAAAPVTLTTEADATELVRLRGRISADLASTASVAPSYTALLIRLVAESPERAGAPTRRQ